MRRYNGFTRSSSLSNPLPLDLDFYKVLVGAGDWILTQYSGPWTPQAQDHFQAAARRMLDRRTGVGGQGLAVLRNGGPVPQVFSFMPGLAADPGEGLLAAAKVLFDSGAFGTGTIQVQCQDQLVRIKSVDSVHFRLELGWPTTGDWPLTTQGLPPRQALTLGSQAVEVLPLELGSLKVDLLVQDPAQGPLDRGFQTLTRRWRTQPRRRALPLLWTLATGELGEVQVPREPGVDILRCGALAGCGAWALGLLEADALVRIADQDYFVEIQASDQKLGITAPVNYSFSGTFSWEGLA